jgi:methionyl-tRNA formyltransferase
MAMADRPLRLVFLGSGAFALPALARLAAGPDELVLAATAPPAPAGRGRAMARTPVALAALEAGVPVIETAAVNSPDCLAAIGRARPDLLIVAAFRGFLGPKLLGTGLSAPMNIHPSLLPRHRGPAPVNWTIISGDAECGVSVALMGRAMDAGPVVASRPRPVPEGLGAGALEAILAKDGAELLMGAVESLKRGRLEPVPQDGAAATTNRLLAKADGRVDLGLDPFRLSRLINGLDPWPGAQVLGRGRLVKLFGARAAEAPPGAPATPPPGAVLGLGGDGRLLVACGGGAVSLEALQPEGRPRMPAADFLRGRPVDLLETIPPAGGGVPGPAGGSGAAPGGPA